MEVQVNVKGKENEFSFWHIEFEVPVGNSGEAGDTGNFTRWNSEEESVLGLS